MRKTLLILAVCLFLLGCSAALSEDGGEEPGSGHTALEIRPESRWDTGLEGIDRWISDAPETAVGEGSAICARNEGFAVLTAVFADGSERWYDVVVAEDAAEAFVTPPELT